MGRSGLIQAGLCLAAVLALFVVQGVTLDTMGPQLADGRGITDDGYTWLGRVERLHEGGGWYDRTQRRIDWPYGEVQHQHRPFDVLLLAGATALTPFLGFEQGLFWWGAFIAPVCYLLLGLAVAWTARSVLGPGRGAIAVLLLATQFAVLNYSIAGRADHHTLLMVLFVLTWGLVARILLDPENRRQALVAGLVAGLGLWFSLEFMVSLAAAFAALGLAWVRRGGVVARASLAFGTGVLLAVLVAVLLERSPAQLPIPQFDRLSIVHLVLAATAWTGVAAVAYADSGRRTWLGRLGVVAAAAAFAVLVMALLFPQFLLGPIADLDPRANAVLVSVVTEELGLWPSSAGALKNLGLMLGLGSIALPGLAWLLWVDRKADEPTDHLRGRRADVWAYLALLALIFVAAALLMMRFAPYAELVFVFVAAEVLLRLRDRLAPPVAGFAGSVVVVALLAAAWGNAGLVAQAFATPHPCHRGLKAVAAYLNADSQRSRRPFSLAAMPDVGPELLYRTDGRVLSTPSRSNEDGAIALFDLFGAVNDREALSIVTEHEIDTFLMCKALGMPESVRRSDRLYARLARGQPPAWLEELRLPAPLDETYILYRVQPGASDR